MVNKGFVDHVHGAISTGKEANVYHATRSNPSGDDDADVAIKVYKTSILVFKDREQYISGDYRFSNGCSKGNPRKMVSSSSSPPPPARAYSPPPPSPGQNVGRKRGAKPVAHARGRHPLPQALAATQPRPCDDFHRPRQQGECSCCSIHSRHFVTRSNIFIHFLLQAAPRLRDADVSEDKWPQLYAEVPLLSHRHTLPPHAL